MSDQGLANLIRDYYAIIDRPASKNVELQCLEIDEKIRKLVGAPPRPNNASRIVP